MDFDRPRHDCPIHGVGLASKWTEIGIFFVLAWAFNITLRFGVGSTFLQFFVCFGNVVIIDQPHIQELVFFFFLEPQVTIGVVASPIFLSLLFAEF